MGKGISDLCIGQDVMIDIHGNSRFQEFRVLDTIVPEYDNMMLFGDAKDHRNITGTDAEGQSAILFLNPNLYSIVYEEGKKPHIYPTINNHKPSILLKIKGEKFDKYRLYKTIMEEGD